MTTDKDSRLVDYLYGELSDEEAEGFERSLESDLELSAEVDRFEETLATLRSVPAEDPSPHLDSLILAAARQSADEQAKKSWVRRIFSSPLAGLVAAGSVAMLVALVSVPAMMSSTSEKAPQAMEELVVDRIPAPAPVTASPRDGVAGGAVADAPPLEEEETAGAELDLGSRTRDLKQRAKIEAAEEPALPPPEPEMVSPKLAKKKAPAKPRRKSPVVTPAPKRELQRRDAPAKAEDKSRANSGDADEGEAKASGRSGGAARGPAGPIGKTSEKPMVDAPVVSAPVVEKPPAPPAPTTGASQNSVADAAPADDVADERTSRTYRKESTKSAETKLDFSKDQQPPNDEAQREEQGRSMLLAASAEFKRGNPVGGRGILVRALALAKQAPVHAEIAFRLAQHDMDRGAYAEAMRYARIASQAPKFDKRNAALEILVEAEKRLTEERSRMMDLEEAPAPAAEPRNEDVR